MFEEEDEENDDEGLRRSTRTRKNTPFLTYTATSLTADKTFPSLTSSIHSSSFKSISNPSLNESIHNNNINRISRRKSNAVKKSVNVSSKTITEENHRIIPTHNQIQNNINNNNINNINNNINNNNDNVNEYLDDFDDEIEEEIVFGSDVNIPFREINNNNLMGFGVDLLLDNQTIIDGHLYFKSNDFPSLFTLFSNSYVRFYFCFI